MPLKLLKFLSKPITAPYINNEYIISQIYNLSLFIFVVLCIMYMVIKLNKEDITKTLDYKDLVTTIKNLKKRSKKGILYRVIPELLIPGLIVLGVIGSHSNRLISKMVSYIIYVLLIILLFIFILGIFKYKQNRKNKKGIIFKLFIIIYIIGCSSLTLLLYIPSSSFRSWLISTSMATMNHQYICKWFYSDKEIQKTLSGNYVKEVLEETDTSLIDVDAEDNGKYANEYEKQVLQRKKNQKYKIIEMEVNGCKAYLSIIYDPSKVSVAVTAAVGRYGQYVTKMAEDNKAILATNGGGFYDPGSTSDGSMPTGVTIVDGKVISNNNYSSYTQSGGLIGFTNDNKLVLMKNTDGYSAVKAGVRDGVSWGPFLIVNGKQAFIRGNGGWGYAARTAIGQRNDGIILLLTVDSNATRTKGASMVDLTEIMSNYGAVNAANLDGGTSTVLVLPKKEALKYMDSCQKNYCYINDPIDSALRHMTRAISSSIIVTE